MTLYAEHQLRSAVRPVDGMFEPGRIIVLNGASSSGKSSVARELVTLFDRPWFVLGIDDFHTRRSRHEGTDEEFADIFQRTVLGFHRAVAGLASAGNDVIVDHILGERWRLHDCLEVFDGFAAYLVGIDCGPAELERRERERGNRQIGRAALQYPLVHAHGVYDVRVSTDALSSRQCAQVINERVESGPPEAIAQLRRELSGDLPAG